MASGPVRHLGFRFNSNGLEQTKDYWEFIHRELVRTCTFYNRPGLSLTARLLIFRQCVLSKALYHSQLCPPDPADLRKLQDLMWEFLWGKRGGIHVKQSICYLPKDCGRLGVPQLDLLFQCQRIRWVQRLYASPNGLWQQLLDAMLSVAWIHPSGRRKAWLPFGQEGINNHATLPNPWPAIISSWKHFSGQLAVPTNHDTLLTQPIWRNPLVPLKESYTSIRLLMKCRLNTFADLWDFTQNRWSVTRLATSLGLLRVIVYIYLNWSFETVRERRSTLRVNAGKRGIKRLFIISCMRLFY